MKTRKNMGSRITGVCLILIAMMTGCHIHDHSTNPGHPGHRSYTVELSFPLDGAGLTTLEMETENGAIDIDGTDRINGRIHVTKTVWADTEWEAEAFTRRVEIHVERGGGVVRVHADYPRPPHHVSVEVSYDVLCRADANLNLLAVNGGIEIEGTLAGVDATTVNGTIHAEVDLLSGEGHFTSTNGSINVSMAECRVPMTATAVNGTIDVALPRHFAGLLHGQTANGTIRCDVPLSTVYVQTPTSLSGRIGTGRDTPIALQTANGNIRVRRF